MSAARRNSAGCIAVVAALSIAFPVQALAIDARTATAAQDASATQRELQVEVVADTTKSEVGLPLRITVRFAGEGADTVAVDRIETLGAFDVLSLEVRSIRADRTEDRGSLVGIELSTLEAGTQAPDPLPYRWRDGEAWREGTVALPAFDIASLVGDDADPSSYRDILGEVEIGEGIPAWIWALGGAAAIAAAIAAWRLSRRRPPAPIAADAWALGALERLEQSELHASGAWGAFYDELTSIVRGYASRRFAIPADRQTSREFLDAARRSAQFPDDEEQRLRALLRLADLVKFAASEPTRAECERNIAEARLFVEHTRPRPAGEAEATHGTATDSGDEGGPR